MDFAGSGVVHLLGASCSLVGCCLLGPRLHRSAAVWPRLTLPHYMSLAQIF